jgi:hypothetical protein
MIELQNVHDGWVDGPDRHIPVGSAVLRALPPMKQFLDEKMPT